MRSRFTKHNANLIFNGLVAQHDAKDNPFDLFAEDSMLFVQLVHTLAVVVECAGMSAVASCCCTTLTLRP